ncbi:MAG: CvpA family protein [Alphaproteobacteria bacterium]|jgi:membrane protein required for colicin V production|nr:CvpA family protein [Alphaproteobacteria bacterium]MDP6568059.1 CvpA family protein [Alphaproteobacteria bacterium]MDP6813383.1 CvpA family protein [Alphaproteobacteria bacterium]
MANLPVNVTDLVILAILVISGVLALSRGFVKEVLSIAGWVLASVATLELFPILQPIVRRYIDQTLIADSLTAVGIFVITLVVVSLISSAISRRVQSSEIGTLDRSLGFLFGLLRGAVVIALAYMVLVQFLPVAEQPEWLRGARAMPAVEYSAGLLARLAPEDFRERLEGASQLGQDASQTLDATIEAGKAAERLKSTLPGADKPGETGYTSGSRQDMNRLIQNRTDK